MPQWQLVPTVWARQERTKPNRPLSRERIVAEAARLLDEEGPDGLSMRRLSARLGSGATSTYRHVASRDDLVELVCDHILSEVRVPTDARDWREALTAFASSVRTTLQVHAWFAALSSQGYVHLGPNMMQLTESMLELLERKGLGADIAYRSITTIVSYVLGVTVPEVGVRASIAGSGLSQQEWATQLRALSLQVSEPYPRLHAHTTSRLSADVDKDLDEDFTAGLQTILDGLEVANR